MKDNPYRKRDLVGVLANVVAEQVERIGMVKLMHVCGSHERTVAEWGLRDLLPQALELLSGPGCPVCVCAEHEIGEVIEIAKKGVTVLSFGDMLRVKTSYGSLMQARSEGADVRVVYSPNDAVAMARKTPEQAFVFFAVGFETTAAPVAGLFADELPGNFTLLTSLKLTAPAVESLVVAGSGAGFEGLIAPGHVSAIVGTQDWERFPKRHGVSAVVAGFEPVDVLAAIHMLLGCVEDNEARLSNEYSRLVRYHGNISAKQWIEKVFDVSKTFWRAVGWVDTSGLFLNDEHARYDARQKYNVCLAAEAQSSMPKGCQCHLVVLGKVYPSECPLYGTRCTLMNPVGPCMVSEEGACRIWQQFGTKREYGEDVFRNTHADR